MAHAEKETSEAANAEQLNMAANQGKWYAQALEEMTKKKAHAGGKTQQGPYIIGWATEKAEGTYRMKDGELEWTPPEEGRNAHIEITVQDAADERFLPYMQVQATLVDPDGNEVGSHQQEFFWHPWLWHYARNWELPGDGTYTLTVRIEAPDFPRHDKKNGKRYAEPVEVTFNDVDIKAGRKG
jgi:hypothetical protein